jgi:trigger factor
LKIQTESLEDRQTQLIIELPDDRLDSAMRAAAKRLGKNQKIHGFRPGKAPYQILLNHLGEEMVFEEAIDHLGQEVYQEALEETEIEPYAPGSLNEIVSREPLILRYVVPLAPEIELGKYREIRLEYEENGVEDSAVDQVMDELRERQALIEPVDRPAQLTDVVVVDVSAAIEGEETNLLNEKEISVLVSEEVDWPVPEIYEHLIGLKAEDEKSFQYTFPDDYSNEEMQNRTATFTLHVHEVKSRLVPEWTDDLAKNFGEYDDLLALRIQVRKDLEAESERQAKNTFANQVIEKVVEGAEINFPPVLLQDEINSLVRDLQQQLRYQNLSLEDYLKIENKSDEELVEELTPQAKDRLENALVLGKVVELEGLEVGESEIDEELDKIVENFKENVYQGQDLEEKTKEARSLFDTPAGRRRIRLDILTNKAVERLVTIAKGEADTIHAASESPPSEETEAEVPVETAEPEE